MQGFVPFQLLASPADLSRFRDSMQMSICSFGGRLGSLLHTASSQSTMDRYAGDSFAGF